MAPILSVVLPRVSAVLGTIDTVGMGRREVPERDSDELEMNVLVEDGADGLTLAVAFVEEKGLDEFGVSVAVVNWANRYWVVATRVQAR